MVSSNLFKVWVEQKAECKRIFLSLCLTSFELGHWSHPVLILRLTWNLHHRPPGSHDWLYWVLTFTTAVDFETSQLPWSNKPVSCNNLFFFSSVYLSHYNSSQPTICTSATLPFSVSQTCWVVLTKELILVASAAQNSHDPYSLASHSNIGLNVIFIIHSVMELWTFIFSCFIISY